MKTKTSILAALVAMAGSASVMAQTVYSLNVVGYVNVNVPVGYSMIANPLKAGSATVASLFTNGIPEGTTLYKYTGGGYQINQYFGPEDGWAIPDQTLAPGEGAFILNSSAAPFTVTFVGEVVQGSTNQIPAGFSIRSSSVPIAAGFQDSKIAFPAQEGDLVYKFVNGNYETYQYFGPEDGWSVEPQNVLGQAFWVNKASSANWVQSYSVQ